MPTPLPTCPHLPVPRHGLDWRALHSFRQSDRGAEFYFACLEYGHALWQKGFAARAMLCLDRALGAELTGDEDVLRAYPLPYAAMTWIIAHTPGGVFLGNPRVHFQHYADRMNEPRREQRRWRAWACWALARAIRPELPHDPKHRVVEPTLEDIARGLRAQGHAGEADLWRAELERAGSSLALAKDDPGEATLSAPESRPGYDIRQPSVSDESLAAGAGEALAFGRAKALRDAYDAAMKTILVAVDSSSISESVVTEAAALATSAQARIVLLTVVQLPLVTSEYTPMIENVAEIAAAGEKAASRHLVSLQERLQALGLTVLTVQRTGAPVKHILDEADQHNANYIVMGSHGHTAFYDLLVGSTTHGVLLRAQCPVLIVPSDEKKAGKK